MGCEVVWTQKAREDVERAVRHIAVNLGSPKAASQHLDAFQEAVERISLFPEAHAVGVHPALARRDLRTCLVKKYVMLYSYDGERAVIYRVFHTLQDYARIIGAES